MYKYEMAPRHALRAILHNRRGGCFCSSCSATKNRPQRAEVTRKEAQFLGCEELGVALLHAVLKDTGVAVVCVARVRVCSSCSTTRPLSPSHSIADGMHLAPLAVIQRSALGFPVGVMCW